MAITEQTLTDLNGRAYGPVSFRSSGGAHAASIDGRPAELAMDGATVRVRTTLGIPWPQGEDAAGIERRIAASLSLAGAMRPELVTLTADRNSSSALVSLWIDADRSDIPELANAVRACVLLADVAWRAVDQVAMAIHTEEQILRETAESQARLEAAERSIERFAPLPASAGPEPVISPPPQASPQPSGPAVAPATSGDARFCPACGARNAPDHRFCISCGQALP